MSNNQITYTGNAVIIDGVSFILEYPVSVAFPLNDKVIVLYDPDSDEEKFGQFRNLVALDLNGKRLWTADLATSQSGDRYYCIVSQFPLVASSIYSYDCEIDPATGKIINRTFFK